MLKRKLLSKYKVPKLLFLSMTLLCWSLTLFQSVAEQIETEKAVPAFQNETISLSESIPAFQTDTASVSESVPAFQTDTTSTPESVPAFQTNIFSSSEVTAAFQTEISQTLELSTSPKLLTQKTSSAYCESLAKQIDAGSTLLSSHSGADYSDYYFYGPSLEKQFQISPLSVSGSNLQIVFVWNEDGSCKHVYIGMPCIEYSF